MPPAEHSSTPLSEAEELADLRRKTNSSRWIFRQAVRKVVSFPSDLSRRVKTSLNKRRRVSATAEAHGTHPDHGLPDGTDRIAPGSDRFNLHVSPHWAKHVYGSQRIDAEATEQLSAMIAFQASPEFK